MNGKNIYLGLYTTEGEALEVLNKFKEKKNDTALE